MQFSYAAIVATLATLACAQGIADLVQQLPSCALTCLATASAAGGCALTDFACQCGSARAAITASATPCIVAGCTNDEAAKTLQITGDICKAAAAPPAASSPAAEKPAAPATKTGATPAVITQIGDGQIQAPVASVPASSFASFASYAPAPAPSKTTTSAPIQVTANAASKNVVGAVWAGAVAIAAFAL